MSEINSASKAFQPAIVGGWIRSVVIDGDDPQITWHRTSCITRLCAYENDVIFFTGDDGESVHFCAARVADNSAAKRAAYDLMLKLDGADQAEQAPEAEGSVQASAPEPTPATQTAIPENTGILKTDRTQHEEALARFLAAATKNRADQAAHDKLIDPFDLLLKKGDTDESD